MFQDNVAKIRDGVVSAGDCLAKASVPFWSPRYAAHMLMEPGYFMTMLYNPNKCDIRGRPFDHHSRD